MWDWGKNVLSYEDKISEGFNDVEVSFSGPPLDMAEILGFKKITDGPQGVTIGYSNILGVNSISF